MVLDFFEKIAFKVVENFLIKLKFMELEYHGKLKFSKLEYPKMLHHYIFLKEW